MTPRSSTMAVVQSDDKLLFDEATLLNSYDTMRDWFLSREPSEVEKDLFSILLVDSNLKGSRDNLCERLDPFEAEMLVYVARGLKGIESSDDNTRITVFSAIETLFCRPMSIINNEVDFRVNSSKEKPLKSSLIDTVKVINDFKSRYEPEDFILLFGELLNVSFKWFTGVSFSKAFILSTSNSNLTTIGHTVETIFHFYAVNDYAQRSSDEKVYQLPLEWQYQIAKYEDMEGTVTNRGEDS